MTAFLAWQAAHGREVEEGRPPTVPAPVIDGDDLAVWNFYCRNATSFVKDFGLMEGRIRRLRLTAAAAELFNEKLDLIHEKVTEMAIGEARKQATPGADKDVLVAADPT